jgi:hypothetical protein
MQYLKDIPRKHRDVVESENETMKGKKQQRRTERHPNTRDPLLSIKELPGKPRWQSRWQFQNAKQENKK